MLPFSTRYRKLFSSIKIHIKEGCNVVDRNWNQFKNKIKVKDESKFCLECLFIYLFLALEWLGRVFGNVIKKHLQQCFILVKKFECEARAFLLMLWGLSITSRWSLPTKLWWWKDISLPSFKCKFSCIFLGSFNREELFCNSSYFLWPFYLA